MGGDLCCGEMPPEKKQRIDVPCDEDVESDDDDMNMTEEEYRPYIAMVKATDGYSVPDLPGRILFTGYIRPASIEDEEDKQELTNYVNYGIEHNKKSDTETKDKDLKFVKLIECTQKITGFITFYITFEAENKTSGEIATYQMRISTPMGSDELFVQQFRRKPDITN